MMPKCPNCGKYSYAKADTKYAYCVFKKCRQNNKREGDTK